MHGNDDPIERRRAKRRRQNRIRLALVGGLFALACVVAGVSVAVVKARREAVEPAPPVAGGASGGPAAELPGVRVGKGKADWNHADLAAHLKAKGVPVRVEGGGASAISGALLSVFVEDASGLRLSCYLTQSEQQARDAAASLGHRATAWGRFVFADPAGADAGDLRRRVLAVLP